MTGMEYALDDLVKVAKRENNAKRNYLYVNPLQGKHIPADPRKAVELFTVMANMLEERYPDEKILVIGFAETATTIGTVVALYAKNVNFYLNTTRESINGAGYLFFTESHSHATEQRLVINGLDSVFKQVDRVVFAEDEVTTGNTIEHLINAINDSFDVKKMKYGIISILNSMTPERMEKLRGKEIDCLYICKLPVEYRTGELNHYVYKQLNAEFPLHLNNEFDEIFINNGWNPRIVNDVFTIREKTERFVKEFFQKVGNLQQYKKILILGTEEFMYPAIRIGEKILEKVPDVAVRTHSTTRSPIEISESENYPLHDRWRLKSVYDSERVTFIYNLAKYDKVFIITDADDKNRDGMITLTDALYDSGNDNITVVRWTQ